MKKKLIILLVSVLVVAGLAACGKKEANAGTFSGNIYVVSREDGSGTRGAFVELTGVQGPNAAGVTEDMTTVNADVMSSTSAVMTAVAGNKLGIGYISLGSLNDTVKALTVDGIAATVENVKNDIYKLWRPFIITVKKPVSDETQDFIDFILSTEGQAVVAERGYIVINENPTPYANSGVTGKILIDGSTSVGPLMERLQIAYNAINPGVTVQVNQTSSGTGITQATDGVCDIGMSSRYLKDSEIEKGLTPIEIALDGVAVIVNKENTYSGLTTEQIKNIYLGEVLKWEDAGK